MAKNNDSHRRIAFQNLKEEISKELNISSIDKKNLKKGSIKNHSDEAYTHLGRS